MNATYVHLLVNHLPLFGALFGTVALVWGLLKQNGGMKTAGLIFLIAASVGGWMAHISGEQAEHFAEELPTRSSTRLMRPDTPPMIGRYTNATTNEADKTKIKVTGNIPMNCPGTPGQNSIGKNAQSVVAVELTTGQNMRLAAST